MVASEIDVMGLPFYESLKLQRIEKHTELLDAQGYFIRNLTENRRKLQDLEDWFFDICFECKTDNSKYTERMLIEYKANTPPVYTDDLVLRNPYHHRLLSKRFEQIPDKYNGLALDEENIMPRHLLSYYYTIDGSHWVMDLRELRQLIAANAYPWIVFESPEHGERWRSVAQIVPLADCLPLLITSPLAAVLGRSAS